MIHQPLGQEILKSVLVISKVYLSVSLISYLNFKLSFFSFKPWAPTFLSMDVDGRVIRTDSFSKILSSG